MEGVLWHAERCGEAEYDIAAAYTVISSDSEKSLHRSGFRDFSVARSSLLRNDDAG